MGVCSYRECRPARDIVGTRGCTLASRGTKVAGGQWLGLVGTPQASHFIHLCGLLVSSGASDAESDSSCFRP